MARSFWQSDPTQRKPYGSSMEGPTDLLWYEVIYLDSLKKGLRSSQVCGTRL